MMKRVLLLPVMAALMILLSGYGAPSAPQWLEADQITANGDFELTDVSDEENGVVSLYSWTQVLRCPSFFRDASSVLTGLGINRLYQELPIAALEQDDAVAMVKNLRGIGVETVFLTGDQSWLRDGLGEYYRQIDALCAYNAGPGAVWPINGVALDVECYATDEWIAAPTDAFADYIELMAAACRYAHDRGLFVVQVIPPTLDDISETLFTDFVTRCCDELSVMNYTKDVNLARLWNEVHVCRALGKPIETIYETQPENDYYGVTEANTYYYDGLDALADDFSEMRRVYGNDVGLSYHHLVSMFNLETDALIADLYVYTSGDDPARDENGQPPSVASVTLTGDDGSVLTALPYCPYPGEHGETCFTVAGVIPGVTYAVAIDAAGYAMQEEDLTVRFQPEDGELTVGAAIDVRPG